MTTNETYHTEYGTAAQEAQTTDGYVDLAGVTAEKSVVTTDNGILQITFDVTSTRTEPIRVEIRDLIPEDIHLDRVGFHPDYGREHWSIEHEHEVVYESMLEPHGDLQTVYAIKPDGPGDLSTVSTETEITGTIDGERAPSNGSSEPTRATGGAEPSPQQSRDATDAGVDDIDEQVRTELPDPNGEEARITTPSEDSAPDDPVEGEVSETGAESRDTADSGGLGGAQSPDSRSDDSSSDGGVIAQLAAELADGRGSDEDLEVLGDHLSSLVEPESRGRNSFDARLQRAESELNELSAYTDALSEFLDERGSGQEILDDLKDQTANVESRLETVAGEVSDLDERLETTVDDVGDIDERLEAAESRDERLADRFDAVDDRHEETTDRLDEVTDRLNTVDVHIETLENDLSSLRGSHDEAGDRIDRIEESVERMDDRLDAAEEARDTQQESLSAEIESMAEDLEEVQNWHRDFGRLLEEFATIGSDAANHGEAQSGERPDTTTDGTSATATEPEADEAEHDAE